MKLNQRLLVSFIILVLAGIPFLFFDLRKDGCIGNVEKLCLGDKFSTKTIKNDADTSETELFAINRRQVIQNAYPDFGLDFENQPCFAGCSVKTSEKDNIHYYAFITHGSGLPIGIATCFSVSGTDTSNYIVSKIGEYPDKSEEYMGFKDVDPKTCTGIK